ncbi:MAG: isoaspartyl peptidase/L-asparaginase [Pirellulales bacterium]
MTTEQTDKSDGETYAVAIHGGCGTAKQFPPQREKDCRDSLTTILQFANQLLKDGSSSVDTVERVARAMEDDPLYNAGKGSAFNSQGEHELDASIMDGRTLDCGAVAGVRTVKNPIALARLIMQETDHVLLIGEGADRLAREKGISLVSPDYFFTPQLRQHWAARQAKSPADDVRGESQGTIGVVALDQAGNLAAATSTGGTRFQMAGRVGDTPIIGAGNYAKNGLCAISCTGRGEDFIRHCVAHRVAALMEFKEMSLDRAVLHIVDEVLDPKVGGLIAVDSDGSISMRFNTDAMMRGAADSTGRFEIAIWPDARC